MKKILKKSLRGYLTILDERTVSNRLQLNIPEIKFVDDQIWDAAMPPLKPGIDACSGGICYIYDNSIANGKFGSHRMSNGKFRGGVYHSIQFIRSHYWEGALLNCELSVCFESDDEIMNQFVRRVWKLFKSFGVTELKYIDGETMQTLNPSSKAQIVGDDAAFLCRAGLMLKHARHPYYWTLVR